MKANDWLKAAEHKLNDIPTARLDALVLLEDAAGKDRGWLLANPETKLTSLQVSKLARQIERRANHEPLAYIRGKSEFYGREFLVTPDTLEPRPETETMITLLKNLLHHNFIISKTGSRKVQKDVVIVDVGTGSGCLAITAKLAFPDAQVYATEINKDALNIAKKNARSLQADVNFRQGDLLQPLSKIEDRSSKLDVLLCNLPYVPDGHSINAAAMHEPKIAIFGGEDGLELYRRLFVQLSEGGYGQPVVLTESLPFQHEALRIIANDCSYKQIKDEDFIQVFEKS